MQYKKSIIIKMIKLLRKIQRKVKNLSLSED